jgi:hypothetical protein
MAIRRMSRSFLAAGGASALLALGSVVVVPTHAGASGLKKHPKKHHSSKLTDKKLRALANSVEKGKDASFQAVYTVNEGGHSMAVTFAQTSSKYLFKTTGGTLIYTGTETLYCSAGTCINAGTSLASPVAGLRDLFSPTAAHTFFTQAEAEVAAKAAGYSVSFSSASYGGLKSECATVTGHGVSGKYCVSSGGLLTYLGSAGGSFTLSSYSGSPPSSDFAAPAGATIETVP